MQTIYGDASNIYLTAQKRLIRVVYGQTQATPYACSIDPKLRNSEGEIEVSSTEPVKRKGTLEKYKNSIMPGTVLVKTEGEYVAPAGGEKFEKVFGLLGQWVGGTFDNIKQSNQVSAWQGFDSVLDILKPAWNEKSKAAGSKTVSEVLKEAKEALTTPAENKNAVVYADENGLLSVESEASVLTYKTQVIGDVVELVNSSVLRIKLRI